MPVCKQDGEYDFQLLPIVAIVGGGDISDAAVVSCVEINFLKIIPNQRIDRFESDRFQRKLLDNLSKTSSASLPYRNRLIFINFINVINYIGTTVRIFH